RTAHTAKVAMASPTRAPIAPSATACRCIVFAPCGKADAAMGARVGLAVATFAVCAVLARRAAGDSGVRVAVAPYTTGITDSSAEIRFELAAAATAKVEVRSWPD